MNHEPILRRYHNILKIVVLQIPPLIVIFGYIAFSGASRIEVEPDVTSIRNLRVILSVTAFLALAAIGPVKRWVMTLKPKANLIKEDDVDQSIIALISRIYSASILTLGICEIPAFLGMIIAMQSGEMRDFYLLAALSFVALFLHFPRYQTWQMLVRSKMQL